MNNIKTIKLRNKFTTHLHPIPPFNFEGTFHKPSHFPETDVLYKNKVHWQTLRFKDKVYGIRMKSVRDSSNPVVELIIYSQNKLKYSIAEAIKSEIEFRFDMKTDLNMFHEECKKDKILHLVIKRWKGMRVSSHVDLYEFLVIATVLQNATVRRSVQMLKNLFQKYGVIAEFDNKKLTGFWSPISIFEITEEELRSLKLGYRAKILKRHAENFIKDKLNEKILRNLPTKELKKKLLSIYGVGPASAQYIIFEVFKRYDVLDYLPPWEQKIYSRLLFNKELVESKVILKEINKRWGRWKMLSIHYIFEDLFWKRKNKNIPWIEKLIRL